MNDPTLPQGPSALMSAYFVDEDYATAQQCVPRINALLTPDAVDATHNYQRGDFVVILVLPQDMCEQLDVRRARWHFLKVYYERAGWKSVEFIAQPDGAIWMYLTTGTAR